MPENQNNRIWIFADHFKVRYVGSTLHTIDYTNTPLETLLNPQPTVRNSSLRPAKKTEEIILEGPVQESKRVGREPYEHILESPSTLIKTRRIDMIYDPTGSIYGPQRAGNLQPVNFEVDGLKYGLVGAVRVSGNPDKEKTDVDKLSFLYRSAPGTLKGRKFIKLYNTRKRQDPKEFQRLFDRTPENPIQIPVILLNITDEVMLSASIPQ